MQTETDISHGIIPLHKEHNQWQVLLIHQYGSAGDLFWTFPKGHAEQNETSQEAAKREFTEETGLVVTELWPDRDFRQSYSFRSDDTNIDKTVVYYLGFTTSTDFSVQENEVKEARWCSFDEANQLLTYEDTKDILLQAQHYLQSTK